MTLFETIGIVHVIFYSFIGFFFIIRSVYLTIKQKPEQQQFFIFKGTNE